MQRNLIMCRIIIFSLISIPILIYLQQPLFKYYANTHVATTAPSHNSSSPVQRLAG